MDSLRECEPMGTPVAEQGESPLLQAENEQNGQRGATEREQLIREIAFSVLENRPSSEILPYICQQLVQLFHLKLVWIGIKEIDGTFSILSSAGSASGYLQGLTVRWDQGPHGEGPCGKAVRMRTSSFVTVKDPNFAPWCERALRYGIESTGAFPLKVRGQVWGMIACYSSIADFFNSMQISFLEYMADQISIVLDSARSREELVRAKQQAESASRLKSEFLKMMSHELRTPLNGILGSAELLTEIVREGEHKELTTMIINSANTLLNVINQILTFSRLETENLSMTMEEMNLSILVEHVVKKYEQEALSKGLKLHQHIDPSVSSPFRGAPLRIQQVLDSLLHNALKFTEAGEIALRVSAEPVPTMTVPGVTMVRFEVADTGIGILPEVQESIFQPFTQVESSLNRKYGGIGMSLAVCQRIVRLLNGNIGVSSNSGQGSTFWFTLPIERIAVPESVPKPTMSNQEILRQNVVILIVENNGSNAILLKKQLRKIGLASEIAVNGQMALKMMERAKYSLVLMDCEMPVMDGFTATRIIRERERRRGGHIPVIALTAHALEGCREQCLACGMDDFLSKPITRDQLQNVVNQWLDTLTHRLDNRSTIVQ
ncbi:GAF domain-containing hybrid sensor histidine kinase/response regulator [Heliophilum fasciatum]|uniref:Circadian input-output histidine kinase CikA n=1 Tax=Heliophilum fasciatum TaxID=35700 RepID=A0A4R2RUJ8_9FIRM|nr:ATP-binding protein [Heliophilum fasciatum]MCW2278480.1 signal transduction histidine kinase/AmiR/NasT family two-component response regulator [Heliophilum fasciatum]TCP63611.1 signal transduction histidine kinase [Heliophilum fasciatum]